MADRAPTTPLERVKVQRERLAEAADALERSVTRPSGNEAAWRDATLVAAVEVGASLAAHVDEVESADGLFAVIMSRSPRLAHEIERLRREHTNLGSEISELEVLARSADATVDDIRESALVLLADISRHRHRGADLIWESFDFDIGEGD